MNYNGQLIALNREEGTYNFNGNQNTLKIDISSVKINLNGNKNSIDVKDSRAAIEIKGDQNRLNIYGSDVTLTDIGQDNIVESSPNSRVRIVKINSPQNILNVPEKQGGFYC
jgi:FlaG/FlaF family flagellin (archaellin)